MYNFTHINEKVTKAQSHGTYFHLSVMKICVKFQCKCEHIKISNFKNFTSHFLKVVKSALIWFS